jgi:hypothetical protein
MKHIGTFTKRCLARGRPALGRFRAGEDASLSVEAVIVMPFLLWAFLATFSFFDVYRVKNLALKANYAISDVLSRETNVIDMDYLLGAESLYEYLTQAGDGAWLRVTVVQCTHDCAEPTRTLVRDWSRATDNLATFSDEDIMEHFEPIIPWIAQGERVIIVETSMVYQPAFSRAIAGIDRRTFTDIVMTRPRFAPQLCFEGIGCGS